MRMLARPRIGLTVRSSFNQQSYRQLSCSVIVDCLVQDCLHTWCWVLSPSPSSLLLLYTYMVLPPLQVSSHPLLYLYKLLQGGDINIQGFFLSVRDLPAQMPLSFPPAPSPRLPCSQPKDLWGSRGQEVKRPRTGIHKTNDYIAPMATTGLWQAVDGRTWLAFGPDEIYLEMLG